MCNALFRLISNARYFFKSPNICFLREKHDALASLPWTFCLLAFYIVTPGPTVTKTVCKYRTCSFLSRISYLPAPWLYFAKAMRWSWEILMFLAAIWSSLCFGWSLRLISPLIVLAPQDSNVAIYPQVCWLFVPPSSKKLPLHATLLKITP